jgi:PPOX class probable F420-dependent enzyme
LRGDEDWAVNEPWVADVLTTARVARLGTSGTDGSVGLVPVCFAIVDGWIVSAVDHKPKRTSRLRRLDDMIASGTATVLIDHYDDEDWSNLWWVRIRGRARVDAADDPAAVTAVAALVAKYAQYHDRPPTGPAYRIAIDEIRSWRSTPAD